MELKDAREYRQLEKENNKLKQMLADSLLKIQVLEEVNAKNGVPFAEAASGPGRGQSRTLLGAKGLSLPGTAPFQSGIHAGQPAFHLQRGHPSVTTVNLLGYSYALPSFFSTSNSTT